MKLDIIIACSKSGGKADKLINNLFAESTKVDFNIHLIKEKGFREKTLNEGMKYVGKNDLLILGDDITLTKGWEKALVTNKDQGDIIGFSMLYPNSKIIQDTGYDLIKIDERITLSSLNRGKNRDEVKSFSYRKCDSICGCAMFINKRVLRKIKYFSEEGQNRWGEFIYNQQAQKLGFKVIVLGHFLYHGAKSTKTNKELKYSSISWQKERLPWDKIIKKYVNQKKIKFIYKSELRKRLRNLLNSNEAILVYGIGTIAELIAKNAKLEKVDFCSGLKEEIGIKFFGKETIFYKDVNYKNYKHIIISPLYLAKDIFSNKLRKYLNQKNFIYVVSLIKHNKFFSYDVTRLK